MCKEITSKRKGRVVRGIATLPQVQGQGFLLGRLPHLPLGDGEVHMTNHVIGVAQKIFDYLVKTTFLQEVETAMRY